MARRPLFVTCLLGVLVLLPSAGGATPPAHDTADVARRAWVVTDLGLDRHIDPCSRQEMLLGGTRTLLRAADIDPPADLGRRVSAVTTPEQWAAFLREVWPTARGQKTPEQLKEALFEGLVNPLPHSHWLPPAAAKVADQISNNRYVGTGIQIRIDMEEHAPQIVTPFRKGPAYRAGARPGDLILEVDGKSTRDVPLRQVVDWLRGDEGQPVTMVVRQPKETGKRTLHLIRAKVPFDTVLGYRRAAPDAWEYRIEPDQPVAYVRVQSINVATLHELRQVEARLQAEGVRAVVLDLRLCGGEDAALHGAELVADGLLDGGVMWRVRERDRVREVRADSECLLRSWPLAVLVDDHMGLAAEAVAAALQDNRRAVLVGERRQADAMTRFFQALPGVQATPPPAAEGAARRMGQPPTSTTRDLTSFIPLPDGGGALDLLTGRLERAQARRGWPVRADHAVALTRKQQEDVMQWIHEKEFSDLPAGKTDQPPEDPQLTKAVALLRAALENPKGGAAAKPAEGR
jgi:C-terminal peptidase prc